jgi:hypothetical protein
MDAGSPEDRATFAAIGIKYGNVWLTEAEDSFVNRVRHSVHLSAYRMAEWLAWNWWRLRWEPVRKDYAWSMAHRMSSVGGGYVWPNITIVSDGERIVLSAQSTDPNPTESLRYLSNYAAIVAATEFESCVDGFIQQVLGQLSEEKIDDSNLARIWSGLIEDRADNARYRRRKLQALLGWDPDEVEITTLDRLLADANDLGLEAIEELAADRKSEKGPTSSVYINSIAQSVGVDANPSNAVRLKDKSSEALPIHVAAWKRGAAAAQALRVQEGLGAAPISNARLVEFSGVSQTVLQKSNEDVLLSFALDAGPSSSKIVLKSKYETGKRFGLARLLGDRIATRVVGKLRPSTGASTYRQKLQRSFAAEFLCPFDALSGMLSGDFSDDAIADVSQHFSVSGHTVRTLLMNHGAIDGSDTLGNIESVA